MQQCTLATRQSKAPEPKDKLDAMGGSTSSTARVNGPEDDLDEWAAVDWRTHEENVRRLRQRIFKATQDGSSIVHVALEACLSRVR